MITRVHETHCWILPASEDGVWHFATEERAFEHVDRYGAPNGGPRELPVPCWIAGCDGLRCAIITEVSEDGDTVHFTAYEPHHVLADLAELIAVTGYGLLCVDCREHLFAPVGPEASTIVTYDNVSRMIAAATPGG